MSLEAALASIAEDASLLPFNGATNLALRVTKRHEVLPALLDLSGINALRRIEILPDNIPNRRGLFAADPFAGPCGISFRHSQLSSMYSALARSAASPPSAATSVLLRPLAIHYPCYSPTELPFTWPAHRVNATSPWSVASPVTGKPFADPMNSSLH